MATGFERDIQRGAACPRAGCVKGQNFGVRFACTVMIVLSDDFTPSDDDRADHGIGTGASSSFFGQTQSAPHIDAIEIVLFHRALREEDVRAGRDGDFERFEGFAARAGARFN